MTIGEKITLARKERNWTQLELGNHIGASRDVVGKYERGEIQPPLEVAAKIAVILNMSLDYLGGIVDSNSSFDKNSMPRELILLLTKIEKLPKSDRNHIEAVVDAFTAQLNSTNK